MSYTFKMETASLHSVNGKESMGVEIEVCFSATYSINREEVLTEIEYIYDCDHGGEIYPNESGQIKLTSEDWSKIERKVDEVAESNFSDIQADSLGSAIDHAMDLMEDR